MVCVTFSLWWDEGRKQMQNILSVAFILLCMCIKVMGCEDVYEVILCNANVEYYYIIILCFCGKLKTTTSVETKQPPPCTSLLHRTRKMSFGKIKLLSLEKLHFGWMATEKITSSKCQMYPFWITKINLSKAQLHEKIMSNYKWILFKVKVFFDISILWRYQNRG